MLRVPCVGLGCTIARPDVAETCPAAWPLAPCAHRACRAAHRCSDAGGACPKLDCEYWLCSALPAPLQFDELVFLPDVEAIVQYGAVLVAAAPLLHEIAVTRSVCDTVLTTPKGLATARRTLQQLLYGRNVRAAVIEDGLIADIRAAADALARHAPADDVSLLEHREAPPARVDARVTAVEHPTTSALEPQDAAVAGGDDSDALDDVLDALLDSPSRTVTAPHASASVQSLGASHSSAVASGPATSGAHAPPRGNTHTDVNVDVDILDMLLEEQATPAPLPPTPASAKQQARDGFPANPRVHTTASVEEVVNAVLLPALAQSQPANELSASVSFRSPQRTATITDVDAFRQLWRNVHANTAAVPVLRGVRLRGRATLPSDTEHPSRAEAAGRPRPDDRVRSASADAVVPPTSHHGAQARTPTLGGALAPQDLTDVLRQGFVEGARGQRAPVLAGRLVIKHRTRRQAVVHFSGKHARAAKAVTAVMKVPVDDSSELGHALHGDEVVVSVHPKTGNMQAADANTHCARVIGVTERGRVQLVATVQLDAEKQPTSIVVPMDPRYPKMVLRARQTLTLAGQRILVAVDDWPEEFALPRARYISSIGPVGDLDTEIKCIMLECTIEDHVRAFPAAAMACLPPVPRSGRWSVAWDRRCSWQRSMQHFEDAAAAQAYIAEHVAAERAAHSCTDARPHWSAACARPAHVSPLHSSCERRDLRWSHPVCSVDPPGCTDIDDALSVRCLPDGALEVGVHIADVTHFVQQHSPLDAEAQARGTTVYLVDRRFDMLPRLLSENVCSLRARVDRYAMSTIWRLHPRPRSDGAVDYDIDDAGTWVGRTIIRSTHALTYDQAKRLLAGMHADEESDRRTAASAVEVPDDSDAAWDPVLSSEHVQRELLRARTLYADDPAEGGKCGAHVAHEDEPELRERLMLLRSVAAWLARRRASMGAVEFDSSELRFRLGAAELRTHAGGLQDADLMEPGKAAAPRAGDEEMHANLVVRGADMELQVKKQEEINNVIAELMIFSNEAVAKLVFAAFPDAALVRRHAPADAARIAELLTLISETGWRDAVSASAVASPTAALVAALRNLRWHAAASADAHAMYALLNALTLRSMNRAEYTSTANAQRSGISVRFAMTPGGAWIENLMSVQGPAELSHFGLGLGLYTHFTSPIRRYADDVAHRQVAAALQLPTQQTAASVVSIADTPAAPRNIDAPPALRAPQLTIDAVDVSLGDARLGLRMADFFGSAATETSDDLLDALLEDMPGAEAARTAASVEAVTPAPLPPVPPEQLEELAAHLNDRNWVAKKASWRCNELFLSLFYATRAHVLEAIVQEASQDTLSVHIPYLGWDADIPLQQASEDADTDELGTVFVPACWLAHRDDVSAEDLHRSAAIFASKLATSVAATLMAERALRVAAPAGTRVIFEDKAVNVSGPNLARPVRLSVGTRLLVGITSTFQPDSPRAAPLLVELLGTTPTSRSLVGAAAPVALPVTAGQSPSELTSGRGAATPTDGPSVYGTVCDSALWSNTRPGHRSTQSAPPAKRRAHDTAGRGARSPAGPTPQHGRRSFGAYVRPQQSLRREWAVAPDTRSEFAAARAYSALTEAGVGPTVSELAPSAAAVADSYDAIQELQRDAMSRAFKLRAEHRHARIDKQKRAQK